MDYEDKHQIAEQKSKKIDEIMKEYEIIMGKELETQRNYFRNKLNNI